jgi:hypothetical protein
MVIHSFLYRNQTILADFHFVRQRPECTYPIDAACKGNDHDPPLQRPVHDPAVARCSFVAWARFAGAAALTLAVTGLEIWLRVPVRPVFNQILAFKRPAHAI